MKKFLFTVITNALVITTLSAQIEKGSIMIGGNAGFQFKSNSEKGSNSKTKEFVFSLTPSSLYSVIKQLAIGGQLSYSFDQTKNNDAINPSFTSTNAFTIGPALRANIFIGGKSYFFFHASPAFGVDINRLYEDRSQPYYSNSIIAWRTGPGFSVFASQSMAVEFGFYYDGMKEVDAIKQDKNVLLKRSPVFTQGLTVAVGLQFYAHKNAKTTSENP